MQQAKTQLLVRPGVLSGRAAMPAVRLSAEAARVRCQAAMERSAEIQRQAHVEATVRRRQRHVAELQSLLDTLPAEWGVTLHTVGPELIAWHTVEWVKEHAGRGLQYPGMHACLATLLSL